MRAAIVVFPGSNCDTDALYVLNEVAGIATDRISVLGSFGTAQWIAGAYLGFGGGALAFILWVLALQRATPTRVANTMTVNPLGAALLATQLVDEPITPNLIAGLVAVVRLALFHVGTRAAWTVIQTCLLLGSIFFATGFLGEQVAGQRAQLRELRRRLDEMQSGQER